MGSLRSSSHLIYQLSELLPTLSEYTLVPHTPTELSLVTSLNYLLKPQTKDRKIMF